jgi:serine phosphatase RsbU (regulator of sigma subunit)/pSer/pThr/pTyr-binding forkhead associated (FHA) protein
MARWIVVAAKDSSSQGDQAVATPPPAAGVAAAQPYLVVLKGPQPGRQFPLRPTETIIGRQADSSVCLESQAVSRHHARILSDNGGYFVEDLQSSNGTYLNSKRVHDRAPLKLEDVLQVGPYIFALRAPRAPNFVDTDVVIRNQVSADPSHVVLPGQEATDKLKVVLEIAQHLARTLDLDLLLGKLLDHLMGLFPQADRGMVVLCENDKLVVRAQRHRAADDAITSNYSRTVVQRALQDGIGILSEDVCSDQRFQASSTVASLQLRSLMCAPLICRDGRRLGVLQLDSTRHGKSFHVEDLQLVTAVAQQAAVVLDNAALHAELLREERLRRELALAQEIQKSFLPTNFPDPEAAGFELFARILPAREVSGDLYDFFPLKDDAWAFFVGDVAGKGIPAALFIIAVRTLSRYLASDSTSPAKTLERLNTALAVDNFSGIFVTLLHGIYRPQTGEITLASGGHPTPLLRRQSGLVEEVPVPNGRFLGYAEGAIHLTDYHLTLAPGETFIVYTDGLSEAHPPGQQEMFGAEGLKKAFAGPEAPVLESFVDRAKAAVQQFTGPVEQQDDQTLMLLRRVS